MTRRWRPWTMGEIKRLKELHAAKKANDQIAEIMDRPRSSVNQYIKKFIGVRSVPVPDKAIKSRLKSMADRGWNQAEMAEKLGVSASSINKWTRAMGLRIDGRKTPPKKSNANRLKLSQAASEQNRRICAGLGWPEVCVPRHARILQALYARPQTALELAMAFKLAIDVCGYKNRSLYERIKQLVALGMVTQTNRKYPGLGRSWVVYDLAPHIRERKNERMAG